MLPPLSELARILVIAGPAHGDVLLATPLIASLRRSCPDAAIDVLVYRGQADILEGNPDVSEILSASKHPGFRESLRLLRRLLRHYDLAISTKHTDRAIWYTFIAGSSRIAWCRRHVTPGNAGSRGRTWPTTMTLRDR